MWGNHSQSEVEQYEGYRIGPKMRAAVRLCDSQVWPSRNQLAQKVGPNGSQQYGYAIVNRARRAGLIEVDPEHEQSNPHGSGAVLITEQGERYLEETDK